MNALSRIPATGSTFSAPALAALALLAAPLASADVTKPADEPSILKDLDIRQVPMAKIQPVPATAPSSAGSELSVMASVDRPDARYRHGDSLSLTVSVSEDAWIWVFDTGTSGKVHQIFPNRYETENFVRAGSPVTIPNEGADYHFLVSRPKGAELLTVIASRNDGPLAQDLIDQEMQAGAFLALRGDAVSVAKDLSISLKKDHPGWVGHHQVVHIE